VINSNQLAQTKSQKRSFSQDPQLVNEMPDTGDCYLICNLTQASTKVYKLSINKRLLWRWKECADGEQNKNKKYKLVCPRGTQTCALAVANVKVNGNGKVILDTHPESDQHQNWTCSSGSPPAPTHQIWWWSMNPFLRYLADKNSAHRQTHADDHKTLRPTARR